LGKSRKIFLRSEDVGKFVEDGGEGSPYRIFPEKFPTVGASYSWGILHPLADISLICPTGGANSG
jgi:hypothetical protein